MKKFIVNFSIKEENFEKSIIVESSGKAKAIETAKKKFKNTNKNIDIDKCEIKVEQFVNDEEIF